MPRVVAPPHAHPHQRDPRDRPRVGRGPQRDRPEDQRLGSEEGRGGAEREERRGVDRPDPRVPRADEAQGAGGQGPDREESAREVVDEVRGAVEEVGLELLREEEAEVDCVFFFFFFFFRRVRVETKKKLFDCSRSLLS